MLDFSGHISEESVCNYGRTLQIKRVVNNLRLFFNFHLETHLNMQIPKQQDNKAERTAPLSRMPHNGDKYIFILKQITEKISSPHPRINHIPS